MNPGEGFGLIRSREVPTAGDSLDSLDSLSQISCVTQWDYGEPRVCEPSAPFDASPSNSCHSGDFADLSRCLWYPLTPSATPPRKPSTLAARCDYALPPQNCERSVCRMGIWLPHLSMPLLPSVRVPRLGRGGFGLGKGLLGGRAGGYQPYGSEGMDLSPYWTHSADSLMSPPTLQPAWSGFAADSGAQFPFGSPAPLLSALYPPPHCSTRPTCGSGTAMDPRSQMQGAPPCTLRAPNLFPIRRPICVVSQGMVSEGVGGLRFRNSFWGGKEFISGGPLLGGAGAPLSGARAAVVGALGVRTTYGYGRANHLSHHVRNMQPAYVYSSQHFEPPTQAMPATTPWSPGDTNAGNDPPINGSSSGIAADDSPDVVTTIEPDGGHGGAGSVAAAKIKGTPATRCRGHDIETDHAQRAGNKSEPSAASYVYADGELLADAATKACSDTISAIAAHVPRDDVDVDISPLGQATVATQVAHHAPRAENSTSDPRAASFADAYGAKLNEYADAKVYYDWNDCVAIGFHQKIPAPEKKDYNPQSTTTCTGDKPVIRWSQTGHGTPGEVDAWKIHHQNAPLPAEGARRGRGTSRPPAVRRFAARSVPYVAADPLRCRSAEILGGQRPTAPRALHTTGNAVTRQRHYNGQGRVPAAGEMDVEETCQRNTAMHEPLRKEPSVMDVDCQRPPARVFTTASFSFAPNAAVRTASRWETMGRELVLDRIDVEPARGKVLSRQLSTSLEVAPPPPKTIVVVRNDGVTVPPVGPRRPAMELARHHAIAAAIDPQHVELRRLISSAPKACLDANIQSFQRDLWFSPRWTEHCSVNTKGMCDPRVASDKVTRDWLLGILMLPEARNKLRFDGDAHIRDAKIERMREAAAAAEADQSNDANHAAASDMLPGEPDKKKIKREADSPDNGEKPPPNGAAAAASEGVTPLDSDDKTPKGGRSKAAAEALPAPKHQQPLDQQVDPESPDKKRARRAAVKGKQPESTASASSSSSNGPAPPPVDFATEERRLLGDLLGGGPNTTGASPSAPENEPPASANGNVQALVVTAGDHAEEAQSQPASQPQAASLAPQPVVKSRATKKRALKITNDQVECLVVERGNTAWQNRSAKDWFYCTKAGCAARYKTESKLAGHKNRCAGVTQVADSDLLCSLCWKTLSKAGSTAAVTQNAKKHLQDVHGVDVSKYENIWGKLPITQMTSPLPL